MKNKTSEILGNLLDNMNGTFQLRLRALFPGFGGGAPHSTAREKRPGDKVVERSSRNF